MTVAVALVGCFQPTIPTNVACGVNGTCPNGTECILELCRKPAAAVVEAAAGGEHTCALLDNGTVRCWGSVEDGRLGVVGITENVGDDEAPVDITDEPHRSLVQLSHFVVDISAGEQHSCAVTHAGLVFCWGEGSRGRLGQVASEIVEPDDFGPVALPAPAIAVTAGEEHSCALLRTATGESQIACWGFNDAGQLGNGTTTETAEPQLVLLPANASPTTVTTTNDHVCAIVGDGDVICWGDGDSKQLGISPMHLTADGALLSPGPSVAIDTEATHLGVGNATTCARLASGAIECWGYGGGGILGRGGGIVAGSTQPVTVSLTDAPGTRATHIAGFRQHVCAVLTDGAVQCWGQAALGETGHLPAPDTIGVNERPDAFPPLSFGSPAVGITVGRRHSCAVLDTGTVYCWGDNSMGQLGNMVSGNTAALGATAVPPTIVY